MKENLTLEEKFKKYYNPVKEKSLSFVDANGKLNLLGTPVIQKLCESDKRIVILQGGGDSGKTTGTLTYLCLVAINKPNTNILITGKDLTKLKQGALKTFNKYIRRDFKYWIKSFNKSSLEFEFTNGSIIKFDSFKDEEDARGNENDYLYMNECNDQSYSLFWQLQRKIKCRVILDYNPSGRFWVHDKLFADSLNFEKQFEGTVVRFITNHWHNPYLTYQEHLNYELITDPEFYRVYSLGYTGKIKGVIYTATACEKIPPDCTQIIWAIDYGYTNDPTAILKIGVRGRDRFMQECLYVPCEDAEAIKKALIINGWQPNDNVFVEHDKLLNYQLTMLGVSVFLADKRSKKSNIAKCKTYNLFYTADSKNFAKEIANYKWSSVSNLTTGEELFVNVPVDGNDHLMDAMIYGVVTHAIMYVL